MSKRISTVMTEKDFYEYVEALCKRPQMYTAMGSFFEIVSYLEGYGAGANVGEHGGHSAFNPFLKWVTKKFEIQDVIINWTKFRELFPSDTDALNSLPILYKEYLEHN